MTSVLARVHRSVLIKLAFIAFLVLVLLVPTSMIESLMHERQSLSDEAAAEIMSSWGREQVIGGPMLAVPYRTPRRGEEGEVEGWLRSKVYLLARDVEVRGALEPQHRFRGLHRVAVYTAALDVTARFDAPRPEPMLPPGSVIEWDGAVLALLVADARAIKSPVRLHGDLGEVAFTPGGTEIAGLAPMLLAPVPGLDRRRSGFEVRLSVHLAGSVRLAILPTGDRTRVSLAAPWPAPSFEGAWLPETRAVDDAGFRASWQVLHLGRGFPSRFRADEAHGARIGATAFGVRLFEPVTVYRQGVRAVKYAVLFIGLTFVAWFMIEVLAARLLHPLQYLLVGFANCMFYLLLLSLSEHVEFGLAYLLAAGASTGLIAGYSASVLASRRLALAVSGVLALTYLFLFAVLRAEDYALLLGAGGLFAALAAVMYLTRRVDWYALSLGDASSPAAVP